MNATLALSGHAGMLIWLGRQYLGQRDAPDEHLDDNEDPTDWKIVYDEKGEENLAKYRERHLRLVRDGGDDGVTIGDPV